MTEPEHVMHCDCGEVVPQAPKRCPFQEAEYGETFFCNCCAECRGKCDDD